jgi:hypothetical protein
VCVDVCKCVNKVRVCVTACVAVCCVFRCAERNEIWTYEIYESEKITEHTYLYQVEVTFSLLSPGPPQKKSKKTTDNSLTAWAGGGGPGHI